MLEFQKVCVKKQGKTIINDISLKAEKGKITALLGKNGSGKSTLLGTASTSEKYKGKILLTGEDISDISPRERAKKLALLPQILPHSPLSVASLVAFGRNPYVGSAGILGEKDKSAITSAIRRAGLWEMRERPLDTLSGGERKRAFIALLLAQETPVILLDEPCAELDAEASYEILTLLRELADEGKTVLTSLHQLSHAVEFADNIAIMEKGQLVYSGDKNNALNCGIIEKSFGLKSCKIKDGDTEKTLFY